MAALIVCVGIHAPGSAQSGPSLYQALGERAGVAALVDRFATHLFTDMHIGPFFKGVDPAETRRRLEAQFCELTEGPCKTSDPDMKKTHSSMNITHVDFDAVVGLLRQSMTEQGLSSVVQEGVLNRLKPLRADIVNTP